MEIGFVLGFNPNGNLRFLFFFPFGFDFYLLSFFSLVHPKRGSRVRVRVPTPLLLLSFLFSFLSSRIEPINDGDSVLGWGFAF